MARVFLRGRMDFICTRPCDGQTRPKGTGTFVPEVIPKKWASAIDRAEAAPHNCHVRDGNTSVTLAPPPVARTGLAPVQDRGMSYYTHHHQFKYRACRRKFYPQFPVPSAMSPAPLQKQHAAVLYGPKDLRYEERTLWPPRQNEAQVKVVATGLCGSDRTSLL